MCIKTAGIPYNGPTIQANCVKRSMMDLCIAIWERVGVRTFIASEVKDLLESPSQLSAMKHRGLLVKRGTVRELGAAGRLYPATVWQMTVAAMKLAEVEGKF